MFLVGGAFVTCLNFEAIYARENLIDPITLFFISYTSTALIMRIFLVGYLIKLEDLNLSPRFNWLLGYQLEYYLIQIPLF